MMYKNFFLISSGIFTLFICVICKQTFLYEKMHRFGQGNRLFNLHDRYGYPEPLPVTTPSPLALIGAPYQALYQGVRGLSDKLVYSKRFKYSRKPEGQRLFYKANFDCKLTHLAVETDGGIPIILWGGAGHKYFYVVTRARPGAPLVGSVRAY